MKQPILILVVVLGVFFLFGAIYFGQPLNRVELNLPDSLESVSSVEFSLPRGEYIVKALLQGEPQNEDVPRKIWYQVTIPHQNIHLEEDLKLTFRHKIRENWGARFKLSRESAGKFSVRLMTPNIGGKKIKLIIIRQVLFRTVL